MKVDQNALAKIVPQRLIPEKLPAWMTKADEIIKGINLMVDSYKEIAGKGNPPVVPVEDKPENTLDFSSARALKKAEMVEKRPQIIQGEKVMPNEFKELLDGAIKTLAFYSAQGAGAQKLGEAIMALPVTVDQVAKFLSDLRRKKYG